MKQKGFRVDVVDVPLGAQKCVTVLPDFRRRSHFSVWARSPLIKCLRLSACIPIASRPSGLCCLPKTVWSVFGVRVSKSHNCRLQQWGVNYYESLG